MAMAEEEFLTYCCVQVGGQVALITVTSRPLNKTISQPLCCGAQVCGGIEASSEIPKPWTYYDDASRFSVGESLVAGCFHIL